MHFPLPHPTEALGKKAMAPGLQLLQGKIHKDGELGSKLLQKASVFSLNPLCLSAKSPGLSQNLGKGQQASEGWSPWWPNPLIAICQFLDPVHDPHGDRATALRTASVVFQGVPWTHSHVALSMAVEMVLPLLGKELDGSEKLAAVPRFQSIEHRIVG